MSSIINNSNANSALINTLESSDSLVNPNVYSTKEIYPMSAMTWSTNQKSNGVSTAGDQMNFNLNKYGIIEQILLNYSKIITATGGVGAELPACDFMNVINRIELLSASRVVSILTSEDLVAQFSDLTASQYDPIFRTACNKRGSSTTAVGTALTLNYVIPLTYGFMQDINTQLNASFLEPLSIRVTWNSGLGLFNGLDGAGADTIHNTGTVANTFLYVRYKAYPEAPTAQILASNYNQPELVQVSTRFYDENATNFERLAGAVKIDDYEMKCELRNTDCVEDFYVMVRRVDASGQFGNPLPIKSIVLRGSGQEILNLNEQAIPYMKLTENGFSMGTSEGVDDIANMRNVAKIQTGYYEHANGGAISNSMSLRELNAPVIEVTVDVPADAAGGTIRMNVMENCTAIYSTSSAIGRLSLALSN
tara:strand:- start:1367 stop:2632 length:1266 start_codon:yes stop_codon:yes gene_type:complete